MWWRSGKPSRARSIPIEGDDPSTIVATDWIYLEGYPVLR